MTAVADKPAGAEPSKAVATQSAADIVEQVVIGGDLGRLSAAQRVHYYRQVCESVGLNPLTRPFDYLVLNGKLILYANRGAGDQLRRLRKVSIEKVEREEIAGLFVVTTYGRDKDGRTDTAIGAVPIEGLKGEAKANAMMKAETKSKRRLTLSIAGLGWLDESEVDTIPTAAHADVDPETGEILRIGAEATPVGPAAEAGELEPLSTTAAVRLPAIPKGIHAVTSLGTGDVTGYVKLKEKPPSDGQLRQQPDGGYRIGFVLELSSGQRLAQVEVHDSLAEALATIYAGDLRGFVDTETNLTGELWGVPWKKGEEAMPPFYRLKVTGIKTREWTLPAPDVAQQEAAAAPAEAKPRRQTKAAKDAAAEAAAAVDRQSDDTGEDETANVSAPPPGLGLSLDDLTAGLKARRIATAYVEAAATHLFGTKDLAALSDQQRAQLGQEVGLNEEP